MTKINRQPKIIVPERVDIPATVIRTASNGVKLHVIDCSDEDVVRVSFIFRAGSSFQQMPFQASATANMLSEGSEKYNSQQIAESFDFVGSYFDVSMDRDYVIITFCCLSKFFEQTMELARQVILHPIFPEQELALYCSKRKQRLAIERSKVAYLAREYFASALFGATHPYGTISQAEDYDRLTSDSLASYYTELYTAANSFVVCSGKITSDISDAILLFAGDLPTGGDRAQVEFPAVLSEKYLYKRQQDAVQSAIRIGTLLFTRNHPDYIPMQVLTTILGGYFGSRLVRCLREEKGYTYGVFAGMLNLDRHGYLAIATEVAAEATADAVEQIFAQMERLRTEPVADEELAMVRNIMVGEVMRVLDGPFGIADVTIENVQNNFDNTYLDHLLMQIRATTPEQLYKLAQKYLIRENFTTVIVGEGMPDQ